jgi:hypothetical protein
VFKKTSRKCLIEDIEMDKNSADRYSGLVTVLAVLVAIFYSEENYDCWDILLGVIGFILAWKYTCDIRKSDILFTILVALLYATSIVAIGFSIIQLSKTSQDFVRGSFLEPSFYSTIALMVILTIILKIIARKRQP